jgi:hypothetical protein
MWDFIDSYNLGAPPGKKPVTLSTLDEDCARFERFSLFVNSWSIEGIGRRVTYIPSHKGWCLVLQSLKSASNELLPEKNMRFLCLCKFNQDHVENLHSRTYHAGAIMATTGILWSLTTSMQSGGPHVQPQQPPCWIETLTVAEIACLMASPASALFV